MIGVGEQASLQARAVSFLKMLDSLSERSFHWTQRFVKNNTVSAWFFAQHKARDHDRA